VFGLSAEWLLHEGRLVADVVVLSHPEQLDRLRCAVPEAASSAAVVGDVCLDRMLASQPLRAVYRRALGADDRQLVVVSSTWGPASLFGTDPQWVARLAAGIPVDDFRVVLVLHPNIWAWHSPWQVRQWVRGCERVGVRVLPPEEGWRAALVAADLVIGDHGSVTFYGAALGRPVLLACAPVDQVDPRSAIGGFLRAAPRWREGTDPVAQLREAMDGYDPAALREWTDLATSVPGGAAGALRTRLYALLRLTEPDPVAEVPLLPSPPAEGAAAGLAWLVVARVDGAPVDGARATTSRADPADQADDGGAIKVDLVRYPAGLLRTDPQAVPAGAHLAVLGTDQPPARWLELADVLVLPADAASVDSLRATLAALPGCRLASAADPTGGWQVVVDGGPLVHFWPRDLPDPRGVPAVTGPADLAAVCGSAVYAWLGTGRPLDELTGAVEIRLGSHRSFTLTCDVRARPGVCRGPGPGHR
jgi:hypothetical protein